MSVLTKPLLFETAFGVYEIREVIGEGGSGRVYGGTDSDGASIAIKVLDQQRASGDKRRRFRNEIAFLLRNKHPHIVNVLDHGTSRSGPFYVMPRYDGNLRDRMAAGISAEEVLPLFSQILDGIEAAHLQGAVHRDLKPENVLWRRGVNNLAIADFGIARFLEDLAVTTVETGPSQRLANFQYAAPEQRSPGQSAHVTADIYALGSIAR